MSLRLITTEKVNTEAHCHPILRESDGEKIFLVSGRKTVFHTQLNKDNDYSGKRDGIDQALLSTVSTVIDVIKFGIPYNYGTNSSRG